MRNTDICKQCEKVSHREREGSVVWHACSLIFEIHGAWADCAARSVPKTCPFWMEQMVKTQGREDSNGYGIKIEGL